MRDEEPARRGGALGRLRQADICAFKDGTAVRLTGCGLTAHLVPDVPRPGRSFTDFSHLLRSLTGGKDCQHQNLAARPILLL